MVTVPQMPNVPTTIRPNTTAVSVMLVSLVMVPSLVSQVKLQTEPKQPSAAYHATSSQPAMITTDVASVDQASPVTDTPTVTLTAANVLLKLVACPNQASASAHKVILEMVSAFVDQLQAKVSWFKLESTL